MAQPPPPTTTQFTLSEAAWGTLPDGRTARRFELGNGRMTVGLTDFGATLLSVRTPDRAGTLGEVTLNRPLLEELLTKANYYMGSTVGRVANRVAGGRFELAGKTFVLAVNNGPNHLHGGTEGFDRKLWEAHPFTDEAAGAVGVRFVLRSPDGEEGYPGNLVVEATYRLTAADELEMDFRAEADAATPVALTNHAYWNLSGDLRRDVRDHRLRVAAPAYLALDATQIPTGEQASVAGTAFDLREGARLGDRIPQVDGGGRPGFDHCFVVEGYDASASRLPVGASESGSSGGGTDDGGVKAKARFMASLQDPASGRAMEVRGTQPGVQVYTANWVDEAPPFVPHGAVCLETEFFPDAVNQPALGHSVVLQPGEVYRHFTQHRFYTLPA